LVLQGKLPTKPTKRAKKIIYFDLGAQHHATKKQCILI